MDSSKPPQTLDRPIPSTPSLKPRGPSHSEQTTFGALTNTLATSITPLIGGLTTSIRTASGSRTASIPPKPPGPPGSEGAFVNDERTSEARTGTASGLWSCWADIRGRRHLVSVELDGLRLWDASDLESLREVSWTRWEALRRPNARPRRPVQARVLASADDDGDEDVRVAVLLAGKDRSSLEAFALSSHSLVHQVEVKGVATELQLNSRVLVLATRSPLALHVFDRSSLDELSTVTTDLASHPTRGGPVFALGQSRLLAYATARRPSDREPGVAGRGFSSPPSGSLTATEAGSSNGGAHGHGTRSVSGGSWRSSVSSGAEAVETARRVGGGLVSGAKALSSWGQQYWSGNGSGKPALSKSAPASGGGLSEADVDEDEEDETVTRRASVSMGQSAPARRRSFMNGGGDQGHVRVIDLASSTSPFPIVAHFTASADPLALLSFNPSSSLLLVASIEGHAFDVFELRPPSRIGKSATRTYPPTRWDDARHPRAWHRYRLYRGMTTAETKRVEWSWDSRVVSVTTERGTHHLYAIHPAGGPGDVSTLARTTVTNPTSFQPLSVSLFSFAKIRTRWLPPVAPTDSVPSPPSPSPPNPCLSFLPPRSGPVRHRQDGDPTRDEDSILDAATWSWPGAIVHDPTTNEVSLIAFEQRKSQPVVKAAQAQARSGLSQLMQRNNVRPADARAGEEVPAEVQMAVSRVAVWDLSIPEGTDGSLDYYPPPNRGRRIEGQRGRQERWTSFAEIATFSRSLKLLPRSVYTSHQFSFALLSDHAAGDLFNGCLSGPRKQLHVRQEVEINPGAGGGGGGAGSADSSPTHSRSMALYGEPIRSAVETVLDAPRPFSPESPSYLAPAWPNGVPGKQGNRWSLAAVNVKPSLVGAHDRMRRELGRLNHKSVKGGDGAGAGGKEGQLRPRSSATSVSFDTDDDEAVSVDPTTLDSATTPRSSVSERDDLASAVVGVGPGGDGGADGDEDWAAWNDGCSPTTATLHAVGAGPVRSPGQGHRFVSPVLGPTPFELDEEEWDDPVAKPTVAAPVTIVTPASAVHQQSPRKPTKRNSVEVGAGGSAGMGSSPGSLSTSPLLTVPTVDSAGGTSSEDDEESELESKESRFVDSASDSGTAPIATPAQRSGKAAGGKKKARKSSRK